MKIEEFSISNIYFFLDFGNYDFSRSNNYTSYHQKTKSVKSVHFQYWNVFITSLIRFC